MVMQNIEAGAGVRRLLAIIGGREEQAAEIVAQFAKQGEEVKAVWYANSRQLLTLERAPRFDAMILFPSQNEEKTNADEQALRNAGTNTPVFRVW